LGQRLFDLIEMVSAMRAAIQIRLVGACESGCDHVVRDLQLECIDLIGGLKRSLDSTFRRDQLQKRLHGGVESFAVVRARTVLPGGPTAHQAQPLPIPKGHVRQNAGDGPPVWQTLRQLSCIESLHDSSQSLSLSSVAFGKCG
jgi:hypothetical protein